MRKFEIAKGFEDYDIKLPTRGSKLSAGYDIRTLEDVIVEPTKTAVRYETLDDEDLVITESINITDAKPTIIKTGIKASMEDDEVLQLFIRSSAGIKRGLMLANTTGIIDADYYSNEDNDGHIMIALYNFSSNPVEIKAGERIAQGIFTKYLTTDDDNSNTERTGGIGSTGDN